MDTQAAMQTLRKSFGPEFHTTYEGGRHAMARVLADRFRISEAEATQWIDTLQESAMLRWQSDTVGGDAPLGLLEAARTGSLPPWPSDDDGYWDLA